MKCIIPKYIFKSVLEIKPEFFSSSDLVIFDIDDTLFFPETTRTKEEIINWFNKVKEKTRCICVSNSRTIKKRQKAIEEILNCSIFLSKHKKPSRKLFREIKEKYFPNSENVFVVGDKIFPDVLFGNLGKATTILVGGISEKEKLLYKIARKIEKTLLWLCSKKPR